jgi:hypothetical protein
MSLVGLIEDPGKTMKHRGKIAAFVVISVGTFCLYAPVTMGVAGIFEMFAPDTCYYLAIAKRSSLWFFTFDGEHPTTGFHPLWQWLLVLLFKAFSPDSALAVWIPFLISVILVCIGYLLITLAVARQLEHQFMACFMIPGVYYLLTQWIDPRSGAPWSFANGMESPLSVFLFGLLLYRLWNEQPTRPTLVGILLALIVSARLDDVFLVPCVVLSTMDRNKSVRDNAYQMLILILPTTIFLGCYLAYNYLTTGMAMPVSGVMKGGFALLHTIDRVSAVLSGKNPWWEWTAMRLAQILLPAIICLIFLICSFFKKKHSLLQGVCLYVLCKAAYNLLYVDLWHQGNWYFSLSIIVMNIVAVTWLHDLICFMTSFRERTVLLAANVAIAVLVIYGGLFFMDSMTRPRNGECYAFWRDRQLIRAKLAKLAPGEKIVEVDDGVVNFSLKAPTFSGLGYAMHKEAIEPYHTGSMGTYLWESGYSITVSLQYGRRLPGWSDKDKFQFVQIYSHPSGAVFYRFAPLKTDKVSVDAKKIDSAGFASEIRLNQADKPLKFLKVFG